MSTKSWQRAAYDAERERDNALAQLAHEQANRRQWQAQYMAEHLDYLNQVEAKLTRLREGIKLFADAIATLEHGKTLDPGSVEKTLRALLDGEAKG